VNTNYEKKDDFNILTSMKHRIPAAQKQTYSYIPIEILMANVCETWCVCVCVWVSEWVSESDRDSQ